jgi:pimeloyl-ACP methyl ester carboxylesterase
MSQVSKLVISSDGCEIFAEGAGSLGGPTIILIHGLGSSTVVFNNLFKDDKLLSKVYLVSEPYYLSNYNLKCCR